MWNSDDYQTGPVMPSLSTYYTDGKETHTLRMWMQILGNEFDRAFRDEHIWESPLHLTTPDDCPPF